MIHLVYVSKATKEFEQNELVFLLEQSRIRNKRQSVTGMLLYGGGNFIQVLEGEQKDVDEVYSSIVCDERNWGNILLIRESIDVRTFPNWSMGFRALSEKDLIPVEEFSEFMTQNMYPEDIAKKPDYVLKLLYQFKQLND